MERGQYQTIFEGVITSLNRALPRDHQRVHEGRV